MFTMASSDRNGSRSFSPDLSPPPHSARRAPSPPLRKRCRSACGRPASPGARPLSPAAPAAALGEEPKSVDAGTQSSVRGAWSSAGGAMALRAMLYASWTVIRREVCGVSSPAAGYARLALWDPAVYTGKTGGAGAGARGLGGDAATASASKDRSSAPQLWPCASAHREAAPVGVQLLKPRAEGGQSLRDGARRGRLVAELGTGPRGRGREWRRARLHQRGGAGVKEN
eukprot:scaffold5584_cov110-Isochrysis_galbana.AAC.10